MAMSQPIRIGEELPPIVLLDQQGQEYDVHKHRGFRNLVLFFYPKDNTPVCTKEACGFRDQYEQFASNDTVVIGISRDGVDSHAAFADKHNLNFTILTDPKGETAKRLKLPKRLGVLPTRTTLIVDKQGIVRHVVDALFNAEAHVQGALNTVREL